MQQSPVNLCFYPTTCVLVDDDHHLLDYLAQGLSRYVPCKTFTRAKQALAFLNQQPKTPGIISALYDKEEEPETDRINTDINLHQIYQYAYQPNRFAEISTTVIDYAIPDMNGYDLAKNIVLDKVKVIMLTGEADQHLAVEAFNEGVIDKFILKNQENIIDAIYQTINQQQNHYFQAITEKIIGQSPVRNTNLSFLYELPFIDYFNHLCKENNIIEYYLINSEGSMLLLNANGKPSWLSVKTEQLMAGYADFAQDVEGVSSDTLQALMGRTHVPLFISQSDFNLSPTDWQPYLHRAIKLSGQSGNYYVAYIKNSNRYQLNKDVVSFNDFLRG